MAIRNGREMEATTTGRRQKLLSGDGYRLAVYTTKCHKHKQPEGIGVRGVDDIGD
jgi:hypothetical protein